jgi:starch-binding outer membrane protein, SusD/RagB family
MNKLNKFLILTLFTAVVFSCESELSTSPFDQIDAESAFQNVTDLNSGALGAYGTISGSIIYEINSLMSDDLRRASTNTGQGMQLFNHNVVSSDNTAAAAWANAYFSIDRINRVLAASENIVPANTAETNLRNQIRGEMLALRAYQHFDLFRIFAGYGSDGLAVPYMTVSVISSPERLTKSEFFTKLLADISGAETILAPLNLPNSRMNIRAVEALRARVALYQQDWSTAIEYASRVIDEVSLTSREDNLSLWNDSAQGEVIFKLNRATANDGTISIFERSTNDDVFFYASNDLINQYDEDDDIRFTAFYDRISQERVKINKYNRRVGQKNVADVKMIRVSEMYLIRAEAYAQPGSQQNLAAAADDINAIRVERYENPQTATFGNSETALTAIRAERRLELAHEGHRFFDLKRAGLPVQRIPEDIDGATTSSSLPADNHQFVMPIPQDEIFANENMVQNPGY